MNLYFRNLCSIKDCSLVGNNYLKRIECFVVDRMAKPAAGIATAEYTTDFKGQTYELTKRLSCFVTCLFDTSSFKHLKAYTNFQ